MVTKTSHHNFARVYVRAWRVRLTRRHDTLPVGAPDAAPPRALSITAPSGGTGRKRKPTASVSERPSLPVEEACRRSSFFIAEVCRGRERWRSAPLSDSGAARQAMARRERIYTAQGYEVKRGCNLCMVSGGGVTFEI